MKIPININFETEPDKYELFSPESTSIRAIHEYMNALRPRLQALSGKPAKFNWMWRIDSCFDIICGPLEDLVESHRDLIATCLGWEDEIGAHYHPYRRNIQKDQWEFVYEDQDWLEPELFNGLRKFEQLFGFKPESIYLTDNILMSERILDFLENYGIQRNIIPDPHIQATHPNQPDISQELSSLDFPAYPYHAERGSINQVGTVNPRNIWMLPTSINYVTKNVSKLPAEDRKEYVRLDLAYHPPTFAEIVQKQLEELENPYLVIVGNSNNVTLTEYKPYFEENLNFLITHPLSSLFQFMNSAELVNWHVSNMAPAVKQEPVYQHWLRQRTLQYRHKFEIIEQTYQTLEGYTVQLIAEQSEKQKLQEQFKSLEAYARHLDQEIKDKEVHIAHLEAYITGLTSQLAEITPKIAS